MYTVFYYWKHTIHSIPIGSDKKLVFMQYVFVIVVFALSCHLLQSIHYAGADTEAKDKDGWTPLMYACRYGHREVAAALLDHGELLC